MRRRGLNGRHGVGAWARTAACVACTAALTGGLAAPAHAAPGDIFTFAGTGVFGFGGDGGPATSALLGRPVAVAWLGDGSALVADSESNRIRRISPRGQITTVAGTGQAAFGGDGGPATSARLSRPSAVEATPDGGFLIADSGNKRVRRVSPAGIITTVAGNGGAGTSGDGGPATRAQLDAPKDVAVTPDGGFLVAIAKAHRVRRVSPGGTITTVAGNGDDGGTGDGGPAAAAQLDQPVGVAALPDGGFLIAEQHGHRVRRVSSDGVIRRVAGTGTAGFGGDGGLATDAFLNKPVGVSATSRGGFLIADSLNGRVRKVGADGTIATIAGTGMPGYAGDGGPAVLARLRSPTAAVENGNGAILIADSDDNRLRVVAGTPPADPPPAPPAELPQLRLAPGSLVRAAAGRVFVPVTCPPTTTERCRATIRLFLRRTGRRAVAAARTVVVARGRFSLAAGADKVVKLELTRAGRRLLRKRREVSVRAVVARRGGPNIGRSSEETTLKVRRKRRRAAAAAGGRA